MMETLLSFLLPTGIVHDNQHIEMNEDPTYLSEMLGSFSNSTADSGSSSSSSSSGSGCEICGWLAALLAMLAFGTFGAPIKSDVCKSLDIDPLVMQTYKTGMCFITSWIFVILRDEEITFTPWGVVSGLFWVPGGVATIYAIKSAGLAIGIGVGSSFIVLVSFYWGIFVFGEHVHSRFQACFAVGCMLLGLIGMAYYSAPTVAHAHHNSGQEGEDSLQEDGILRGLLPSRRTREHDPVRQDDPDFIPPDMDEDEYVSFRDLSVSEAANTRNDDGVSSSTNYVAMTDRHDVETENPENNNTDASTITNNVAAMDGTENDDEMIAHAPMLVDQSDHEVTTLDESSHVLCCFGKISIQRRTLGILVAVFSGVYGGSIMAPLKFAPPDCKGLGFLISFAFGASIVTLTLWILRFLLNLCRCKGSFKDAYNALPSFHFRKMWPYGCSCGLIWSVGNFFSILSVEFLGEGVGYSVTQASILVSGLWGIFYFKEIEGTSAISKWMLSASVTVTGILLLSYEHHEK